MDVKQIAIALTAATFGALFSAWLAYTVRLKAKSKEDIDSRRRLALVHFLRLTDVVAADLFFKDLLKRLATSAGLETNVMSLSHLVAVYIADGLAAAPEDEKGKVTPTIKAVSSAYIAGFESFKISDTELGHMSEVAIYCYHQFVAASFNLKASIQTIELLLEGNWKRIDAGAISAALQAHEQHIEAAGVLRAALAQAASIPDSSSINALLRSFNGAKTRAMRAMENNAKLTRVREAAREAAMATAEAKTD